MCALLRKGITKKLSCILSALLASLTLAIAGCSGTSELTQAINEPGNEAKTVAETAAADEAQEVKEDTTVLLHDQQCAGKWFAASSYIPATDLSMKSGLDWWLDLNADGTGSMWFLGIAGDVRWEGTKGVLAIFADGTETHSDTSFAGIYSDEALVLCEEDNGIEYYIVFTRDGQDQPDPEHPEISFEDAEMINSPESLVGEWQIAGVNLMTTSVYGPIDTLTGMGYVEEDASVLTLKDNGSAMFLGQSGRWYIDDQGATIFVPETGFDGTHDVRSIGDSIIVTDQLPDRILLYSRVDS